MSVGAVGGSGSVGGMSSGGVSPVGACPSAGDALAGTSPVGTSGPESSGSVGSDSISITNSFSCDSSMSTETFTALRGTGSVEGQDPMMESIKKLVELMLMLKMLEMLGQQ